MTRNTNSLDSTCERTDGTTAAEVVASYRGTIINVTHVGPHRKDAVAKYTIGESVDVTFPTPADHLGGRDALSLVEHDGVSVKLRFTRGMTGYAIVGDNCIPLWDLAQSGEYKMPAGVRCTVHVGDVTFTIRTVAAGFHKSRRRKADVGLITSLASAAAGIGALIILTQAMPADPMAIDHLDDAAANRYVGYFNQPDLPEPEPAADALGEPGELHNDSDAPSPNSAKKPGEKAPGTEGKARGDRRLRDPNTGAPVGPINGPIALTRGDFDSTVRADSVLGLVESNPFGVIASREEWSGDGSEEEMWARYRANGGGDDGPGSGLAGRGRGGGGDAAGLEKWGDQGLLGQTTTTESGGRRYKPGTGAPKLNDRKPKVPKLRIAKGQVKGGLSKDMVRRKMNDNINKFRHCYNAALVGNPNLTGRVELQFMISPVGRVTTALAGSNTTGNAKLGKCMAGVTRGIRFPAVNGGGTVFVTYPIQLNT